MRKNVQWTTIILACMLLALGLPAQKAQTSDSRASKYLEMSKRNNWHIGYTTFNADFPQDLKLVAEGKKGDIGSSLYLFRSVKNRETILWTGDYRGEWVAAAFPWQSSDRKTNGFLIVTRGGAGNRYRVLILVATQSSAQVALNEVGYGPPYMPELVNSTKQGKQAIILPDMESYPQTPTKANVCIWNTKTSRFSKQVVKWSQRFDG